MNIILKAKSLERIYVCSDDEKVWAECNHPKIVVIKEPRTLAQLDSTWRVINWVMFNEKFNDSDVLYYLPSTSPLRSANDIDEAFKKFKSEACTSLVSVRKNQDPPEWSFVIKHKRLDTEHLKMTSQKLRPYFCLNGSIYISTVKNLKRYDGYFGGFVLPYIMPYERSINIDSLSDFQKAEKYYTEVLKNEK